MAAPENEDQQAQNSRSETPPPQSPQPQEPQAQGSTREEQLDRALRSRMRELPENRPKGILGERNPDLRTVDGDQPPDLNAGISQENDRGVVWLAVVLGFLLGFVPGFVILWASKHFTRRQKVIWSIGMAVAAAAIVAAYAYRR